MTTEATLSTLRRIGHEIVGPAFSVFVHRIVERSSSLGIGRLMFLAREGQVFRSLYDVIAPRVGSPLPTRYLYVSRLSTALPAVHGFGTRELRIAARRPGARSIRRFLETFNLDETELLPRAYAAGFKHADEPLTEWWNEFRFDTLLEDRAFQALVNEQAERERALFRAYLEREGFFEGGHVGLVDVGWTGTIQDAIARAFRDEQPSVRGFYFGLRMGTPPDPRVFGDKEGLVCDFRRHTGVEQLALFSFPNLFEQAARAHHGTTLRYEVRDGLAQPVVNERGAARDAERQSAPLVAAIQEGIAAAGRDYADAPPRWAEERLPAAWRAIDRLVYTPTRDEVDALSRISHTYDWGDADSHGGLIHHVRVRPGQILREFHASNWRGAFLRNLGGPMLPLAYRRYLTRRS